MFHDSRQGLFSDIEVSEGDDHETTTCYLALLNITTML